MKVDGQLLLLGLLFDRLHVLSSPVHIYWQWLAPSFLMLHKVEKPCSSGACAASRTLLHSKEHLEQLAPGFECRMIEML